ncbi:unnamed protein product [Leuciscus chuanchicus]
MSAWVRTPLLQRLVLDTDVNDERVHTIPHGDALVIQPSTPGARAPRDVTCPSFLLCAWAELVEWLGTRCNSPFVIHEERKLSGRVKYSRSAKTIELDNLGCFLDGVRLSTFLLITSLLMGDVITSISCSESLLVVDLTSYQRACF